MGAIVAVFALLASHRIDNYWQWGHDGYNGAAFTQAARNSMRFRMPEQVQYYTGISPPPTHAIYTHHPLLLHAHLVAAYAFSGFHEWVGRMVPTLYAVGSLILLIALLWRHGPPYGAVYGGLVYLLTPLHLIFANMVNHEQGCIFWCLAACLSYLAWLKAPQTRLLVLTLCCLTCAVQFDWPGYYFAFLLFLHLLFFRQRQSNVFAAAVAITTWVNALSFFVWIRLARGSLENMWFAFSTRRTGSGEYYLQQQVTRLFDLHGGMLLLLFFVAAYVFARHALPRGGRKQATEGATQHWHGEHREPSWTMGPLHLVALGFLLMQLIHSTVFPGAAYHHSYWTYFLGPATAITLGMFFAQLIPWLRRRADQTRFWHARAWARIAALGIGVFFCYQAVFTWQQFHWGKQTGNAAYVDPYDDQFVAIRWAQALAQRYPRPDAAYYIDATWGHRRIEFDYYLDSPLADSPEALRTDEEFQTFAHRLVLFNLETAHHNPMREWATLCEKHHVQLWDDQWLVVDVSQRGSHLEQFRLQTQPTSWLWRWWVNPDRPRTRWVSEPNAQIRQHAMCQRLVNKT